MLDSNGLPIDDFTKVIFMQLHEVKNKVAALSEAEYTVAMLHELFGQIDYNGECYFCFYVISAIREPQNNSPFPVAYYITYI